MIDLPELLDGVKPSGSKSWTARCPGHSDQHNSLSIARGNGCWLLKCHAGCDLNDILKGVGLTAADLFDNSAEGAREYPSGNGATVQPGLTLVDYATLKRLPVEFLQSIGVIDSRYSGREALRIQYPAENGEEKAVRYRIAPTGDRFRWKSGSKPCLYGLQWLPAARKTSSVVLVEGESDCHTLWFHEIPAVGLPGASNWREDRDAGCFDGVDTIYVVLEPDRGGEAVARWLSQSRIRERVKIVRLAFKDVSGLYLDDSCHFMERWTAACAAAPAWTDVEARQSEQARGEAWEHCSHIAQSPGILDLVAGDLSKLGVVGEARGAKLVYLVATSRVLELPVSLAVKGPSSGGKSFLVDSVLKMFPADAFYALTAMSDRALAYSTEPLRHRHLVIYEAAGLTSDFATYLIRSLLSEGKLRYETVDKTNGGLTCRLIEREGPTGLIVTTTSLRLHPENETRMLSLTITDTREQTAAIFQAVASEKSRDVDLEPWKALQTWVACGPRDVVIPYAPRLAALVPPVAIRLRRDFKTFLMLVKAHALLHQASREKDAEGRVIASLDDYKAVRTLVADLVAEGVEARVKGETREVVELVSRLIGQGATEVRQIDLRKALQLDKSAISRRIAAALDGGFLRNLEDRKGKPARLVVGEPIPTEQDILPEPELLTADSERLHGCAIDREDERLPAAPVRRLLSIPIAAE